MSVPLLCGDCGHELSDHHAVMWWGEVEKWECSEDDCDCALSESDWYAAQTVSTEGDTP